MEDRSNGVLTQADRDRYVSENEQMQRNLDENEDVDGNDAPNGRSGSNNSSSRSSSSSSNDSNNGDNVAHREKGDGAKQDSALLSLRARAKMRHGTAVTGQNKHLQY